MVIYLYADIYFAVNFIMNWSLLWLSGRLLGIKLRAWRGVLAASVGALYAVFVLVFNSHVLFTPFSKIPFSFFMVAIAFGPRSLRQLLRQSTYFFMVAIATAGAFIALEYLAPGRYSNLAEGARRSLYTTSWMPLSGVKGHAVAYPGIPWWFLLAAVLLAGSTLGIVWLEMRLHGRLGSNKEIYNAEISFPGSVVHASLLLDTGNTLKDPYTGAPVVVLDPSVFSGVLPSCLLEVAAAGEPIGKGDSMEGSILGGIGRMGIEHEWILNRVRLIPFTSFNGSSGMLFGLRPDSIEVCGKERKVRTDRVTVALSLVSRDREHLWNGLLHPDIMSSLTDNGSCNERGGCA